MGQKENLEMAVNIDTAIFILQRIKTAVQDGKVKDLQKICEVNESIRHLANDLVFSGQMKKFVY